MSADNWAVCPRCKITHDKAVLVAERKAENAYGQVPMDEWKELDAKARKMADTEPPREFREDYEFYGAEDGVVTAKYSGGCRACGLSLEFKHEVPIQGIETPEVETE